ncbi:MAG: 4'-phosphopantetheinyl transferase superfamily protein [Clostridiales bacterium]|uniref:4'-phosphopantetheinyl transferase family protein n=1 Tax=Flavonifractor porci TaxID=3133422 RepID=UPI0030A1806A|nr:4'-phosphopantetheinyl transferase superfamily protein [Clostridiales bacterium]
MKLRMEEGDAWALLARLLREEFGWTELPRVAYMEWGKPWFPDIPGLHFNLSHSGSLALCGAGAAPLGVDVERVRPRRAGLARYVLSEEEFAWFQGRGEDWGSLYTLWTLKEAKVKCLGTGLRQPPRTIAVPLLEPGQTGEQDGLCFGAYAGPDWRAAVCTAGEEPLPLEVWAEK